MIFQEKRGGKDRRSVLLSWLEKQMGERITSLGGRKESSMRRA